MTVHDPLQAARERSRAQVARYQQIRAALEGLRVTATSADRSVTVELAAGGAIVDLRLSDLAMGKTPQTLSAAILEAIRAGLLQVAERTTAEVEPLTGRRVDVTAVTQGRMDAGDDAPAAQPVPSGRRASSDGPAASDARFAPEE